MDEEEKVVEVQDNPETIEPEIEAGIETGVETGVEAEIAVDLNVEKNKEIEEESKESFPVHYTFRTPFPHYGMPTEPLPEIKNQFVKSPPFYLYLDHTIGVIWSLFSKDSAKNPPLGIGQLQWALNFFEAILNESDGNCEDISVCVEAIQEELIQQYAQMAEVIEEVEIKSKIAEENQENDSMEQTEEIFNPATIYDQYFSINYHEMLKRFPSRISQFLKYSTPSIDLTSSEMDYELSIIKDTYRECDKQGKKCPLYAKDSLMEFLMSWRDEQLDKIQIEINRLESIESILGKAENEEYRPAENSLIKTICKEQEPE